MSSGTKVFNIMIIWNERYAITSKCTKTKQMMTKINNIKHITITVFWDTDIDVRRHKEIKRLSPFTNGTVVQETYAFPYNLPVYSMIFFFKLWLGITFVLLW